MAWSPQVGAGGEWRAKRPGALFRWLVTIGWVLVISATFAFGYWLARFETVNTGVNVDTLREELARLSEEVARGREERLRLERAHQMDREAKRQAQESLAELQRERLELIKRVSYLHRLVRDGQSGIVEVKDLQLREGSAPGSYHFEMLLSELVPQDERTRGLVNLSLVLSLNGEEVQLSLDAMPGSSPGEVPIDFEYFQAIAGDIVLPDGADAERLIVDIQPEGVSLASSSEAFLWPSEPGEVCLPSPILETFGLDGPAELE